MTYDAAFWDWLRYVNIAIAVIAVVRLVEHRVLRWNKRYPERDKIFWYALVGGVITAGQSAVENLVQDNPGGPRVVLTFVYLMFTLWGTFMTDPDRFRKAATR